MVCFFRTLFSAVPRRGSTTVLAFVLLCGFSFGSVCAVVTDAFDVSLISKAAVTGMTFPGLLCVMLLPLVCSALAAYIHKIHFLMPIAFLKSFAFGYLASAVLVFYGSSGWLMQLLFLFSDCFSFPVLCKFWIAQYNSSGQGLFSGFAAAFILIAAVVFLDCQYISPYLVMLLS